MSVPRDEDSLHIHVSDTAQQGDQQEALLASEAEQIRMADMPGKMLLPRLLKC